MEAHGLWRCGDGGLTAFLVDISDEDAGALGSKGFGDGRAVAGAAAFRIALVVGCLGERRGCMPVTIATLPARRPAWVIADILVVSLDDGWNIDRCSEKAAMEADMVCGGCMQNDVCRTLSGQLREKGRGSNLPAIIFFLRYGPNHICRKCIKVSPSAF